MRIFFLKPTSTWWVKSVMDWMPNETRAPYVFALEYVNNIDTLLSIHEAALEHADQEFQIDMELNF